MRVELKSKYACDVIVALANYMHKWQSSCMYKRYEEWLKLDTNISSWKLAASMLNQNWISKSPPPSYIALTPCKKNERKCDPLLQAIKVDPGIYLFSNYIFLYLLAFKVIIEPISLECLLIILVIMCKILILFLAFNLTIIFFYACAGFSVV